MSKNLSAERLVQEVKQDYLRRREQRRSLEAQWQLNINFYMGNQYSYILSNNNVADSEKQYFWEEKEVFNHIAPVIETRIAKLLQLSPDIKVLPATNSEKDVNSAKLSVEIFNSVKERLNLAKLIKNATTWSEICGTAFYKIVWNNELGLVFGEDKERAIKLGDVDIAVCSPFEIFPDNLSCENIDDLQSIIQAKAVDVNFIKSIYGVNVAPEKCYAFSLDNGFNTVGGLGYSSHINKVANNEVDNACVLIERYTKPNSKYPNGRLTIVAGDKLLFDGDLPYILGENKERKLPFVKQVSTSIPGNFFGVSVVERLVPIQRAYNTVRNRKHEFFNRASMGVLTVEAGSVDTDALEQDGLSPGKVLIYRQGSKAPTIMENPDITSNFEQEEERLLDEFKTISGINDIMKDKISAFNNLSGTAIQLLMEQDEQRLQSSTEEIKYALVTIARYILKLYKQFAVVPRIIKIAGSNNEIKMHYWDKNEISSDEVVFDAERLVGETLASRRTMLMELINSGIMFDEEGKFSHSMRKRCLDLLGFGMWENSHDIHSLHISKAQSENFEMNSGEVEVLEIDEHKTHIDEHIAYAIGGEIKNNKNYTEILKRLTNHIKVHKQMMKNIEE